MEVSGTQNVYCGKTMLIYHSNILSEFVNTPYRKIHLTFYTVSNNISFLECILDGFSYGYPETLKTSKRSDSRRSLLYAEMINYIIDLTSVVCFVSQ